MKKPKICFVTSFFYPTIGGVENHIFYLAKELIKLGYDIEVFTSNLNRDKKIEKLEDSIEGIKINRFKSWFKIGFAEIFFPKLFLAVRNSDADIFHVHGYRHSFNFIFWFTKKPIFLTPHWPIYRGERSKINQFIVDVVDKLLGKYIFKHFKKICVVTELESKWLMDFGVPKKNIILTPNCLPEEYFKKYNGKNFRNKYKIKREEIVILSLSRIHKSKGIDQLIKIAKFFPEAKLVILGKDGGYKEEIKRLINDLNLKNVILGGEVSEKEKLEAYAGSDIFCAPSHYEAFCISLLEAMSQGCAVIASNVGGMPWVVDNAGLIFEDRNLTDLKNKIGLLIKNAKLRNRFKKIGQRRARNFRWHKVAEILNKEYKKLYHNPINKNF